MEKEYGTKCSIPGCANESENLHHEQRYAIALTHDPHYLAPVCEPHHEIAHTIDIKYQERKRKR